MEFFEANQISEWAADLGLPHGENFEGRLPEFETRHSGTYAEGRRSGREAVAAADLLARLGPWDECLVWIRTWGIWPSGEDWPEFYAWRGALGERRSLDKAPGHRFERGEARELTELLTLVMENAWDADVLCALSGRISGVFGHISHDEWYEIRESAGGFPTAAG